MLGKHQIAVHDDIEYALFSLDQLDLSAEPIPQCRRQTGGAWEVASEYAISD